jgi:hypothetical protein
MKKRELAKELKRKFKAKLWRLDTSCSNVRLTYLDDTDYRCGRTLTFAIDPENGASFIIGSHSLERWQDIIINWLDDLINKIVKSDKKAKRK